MRSQTGASPASRDREGGKMKIRGAKVFAEIRRLFLAKIENFHVFFAQTHQLKKIPWGARKKSGGGGKNENRGALPPLPLATRLVTNLISKPYRYKKTGHTKRVEMKRCGMQKLPINHSALQICGLE